MTRRPKLIQLPAAPQGPYRHQGAIEGYFLAAMADDRLSRVDLRVLAYLVTYSDPLLVKPSCCSWESVARDLGLSYDGARRSIRALERYGFIKRSGYSNRYKSARFVSFRVEAVRVLRSRVGSIDPGQGLHTDQYLSEDVQVGIDVPVQERLLLRRRSGGS